MLRVPRPPHPPPGLTNAVSSCAARAGSVVERILGMFRCLAMSSATFSPSDAAAFYDSSALIVFCAREFRPLPVIVIDKPPRPGSYRRLSPARSYPHCERLLVFPTIPDDLEHLPQKPTQSAHWRNLCSWPPGYLSPSFRSRSDFVVIDPRRTSCLENPPNGGR